jgi:trehalose 6-phosphate synthase
MLQIAAASREENASYQALRQALEREVAACNQRWETSRWKPVHLAVEAWGRGKIAGLMRTARIGLVTPLRDGMNLVAKEFVAAQNPLDPGVLVLSRFAGAAQQLTAALLVDPRDSDQIAAALAQGLSMSLSERQGRWRAMWNTVATTSSSMWGRSVLAGLPAAVQAASRLPAADIMLSPPTDSAPIVLH